MFLLGLFTVHYVYFQRSSIPVPLSPITPAFDMPHVLSFAFTNKSLAETPKLLPQKLVEPIFI